MKRDKEKHFQSEHRNHQKMHNEHRRLLITGATGYLGQHLIKKLIDDSNYLITIITRDKVKSRNKFSCQNMDFFDYSDMRDGHIQFNTFDFLIHLGFTREKHDYHQIAKSLETTNLLFNLAMMQRINAIVNISSLNVYGLNKPPFWKETDKLYPELPFGMAKFATELILRGVMLKENSVKGTSLRLSALSGGSIILNENELICKLIDQVLKNQQITIYGGQQWFERLDVHDAISAIVRLINIPPADWKPVYNLGANINYSLSEIAEKVLNISKEFNLNYSYDIKTVIKEDKTAFGLDCSLFMNQMDWEPSISIDDTIRSVFLKKIQMK